MKQLACEMCGGTDLIKQDGVFVCQNCGMKYSVEEAKKMMIEGTVDVKGTVKVDNSALVEKYLQNARRAYDKEDWEEVERYYNKVEENDPTNIEAIFYSTYGKARQSLSDGDYYKRAPIFNTLKKSISIVDDNFDMSAEKEQRKIITRISKDIISLGCSSYVYRGVDNGNVGTMELFFSLCAETVITLKNIVRKYNDKSRAVYLYELIVEQCEYVLSTNLSASKNMWRKILIDAVIRILRLDPDNIIHEELYSCGLGYLTPVGCMVAMKIFTILDNYEDSKQNMKKSEDIAEKIYKEAERNLELGGASGLNEANRLFNSIAGYSDANKRIVECQEKIREHNENIKIYNRDMEKLREKNEIKNNGIALAITLAWFVIGGLAGLIIYFCTGN